MHTLIQLSCFYNNDTVIVAYDNIVTDGNSLCDKSRAESDGGGCKMCSSKCLYSSSCLPSFCSQAGSGHIQGQPFCPHCKSLSVYQFCLLWFIFLSCCIQCNYVPTPESFRADCTSATTSITLLFVLDTCIGSVLKKKKNRLCQLSCVII